MKEIRTLRADEIECRVGTISGKGLSLLLYKDARADQRILDEVFGPLGWKRSHQVIDGKLYCTVEVWDEEKSQWVSKQDVGTASYSEAEKGQASDSFKRACVNWGIGRELYTAPFIWIPANKVKIECQVQGKNEKYYTHERFSVASIGYDENRSVVTLVIVNAKHHPVYILRPLESGTIGIGNGLDENGEPDAACITAGQRTAMERELKKTGVALEKVLERYGIKGLNEMTGDKYEKAMRDLRKSRSIGEAA